MSLDSTIKLVKSLSSAEKRHFMLYTKKQDTDRFYIKLFKIINQLDDPEKNQVKKIFFKMFPDISIYNTCRYLTNFITDCLIDLKSEKDTLFSLLRDYKRVKIFQERFLKKEALKTITNIQRKALEYQHPFLAFLSFREELELIKSDSYRKVSANTLVEKQMQGRDQLKTIFSIHELQSLFEILEHRMINQGKVTSDKGKEELNDLIISELAITNPHLKNNFAAKRLRLNFQSDFFTNIGDYQSALKTFTSLNDLFETNKKLLETPPLNYLSALNGILHSLFMLNRSEQIPYYINKVEKLNDSLFSDYFRNRVQKIATLFKIIFWMASQKYIEAQSYIEGLESQWYVSYNKIDEENQWELYFFIAKNYFELRNFKKTHKWIDIAIQNQTLNSNWHVCKAVHLLNIITYYELGERSYLDYLMKNYNREFGKKNSFLAEMTLIKFLKEKSKQRPLGDKFIQQIIRDLSFIQNSPYEFQLLKYFNFTEWVRNNLKRFP